MSKELKANAQSVYSNLGGGAHGHLGIVLSPAAYALISNTPYETPMHPGSLTIPPGTTQIVARNLQSVHEVQMSNFKTHLDVKKALIQQIVIAVESSYLDALRNPVTKTLDNDIHAILAHLMDTYGDVTPEKLSDYEDKVKAMVHDPSMPIDSVFNAVQELCDFSEQAQTPYTQAQAVNMALVIILRTGSFAESIKEWNRKTRAQRQNWINFKNHFRNAHKELRATRIATMSSQFQQANLVQQVVEGIQQAILPGEDAATDEFLSQVANATTQNQEILPKLLEQMQQMKLLMESMQTQMSNSSNNSNNNNSINSNQRQQRRTPNRSYYCWTHGACAHEGRHCNRKADGHKDEATFSNKMGGSSRHCNSRSFGNSSN